MPDITFVAAEDELKGKRAAVVADMIRLLAEAEGEPVTWDELIQGVEHPHQYTPALHALEMVGVIERWGFVEPGRRKHQTAYSIKEGIEVEDGNWAGGRLTVDAVQTAIGNEVHGRGGEPTLDPVVFAATGAEARGCRCGDAEHMSHISNVKGYLYPGMPIKELGALGAGCTTGQWVCPRLAKVRRLSGL